MTEKIWSFAERILMGFAFLLPVFFIPSTLAPFQFSKVYLAMVAVALVLIVYSIKTLRSGTLSLSWSRSMLGIVVLPVAVLIATVFSSNPSASFTGYQLDADTFGFMLLCSALAFAVTVALRDARHVFNTLLALLISSWVVIVFQLIQLYFKTPFSFGIFDSVVGNLVGKWNDLGLFLGLIVMLCLIALQSLSLSTLHRWLLVVTTALSLILLSIVNFSLSWMLVGVASFAVVLNVFAQNFMNTRKGLPSKGIMHAILPTIAILMSLFFLFAGTQTSTGIQNTFNIQTLEIRPSIAGTLSVMGGVYNKSPIVGSGPNTFADGWLMYRPSEIVATPFWNVGFNAGFGQIPTNAVTGGILVMLAWLILIGLFAYTSVRALLTVPEGGDKSYFLLMVSTAGTAYMLLAHFFYVPSQSMTLLLFLFLGLFYVSLRGSRFSRDISVSFSEFPRFGFISVVVLAVLIIGSLASVYETGALYASSVSFDKAVERSSNGDVDGTLKALTSALSLSTQDRYYRLMTTAQLASLQALVQTGKSDAEAQAKFKDTLSNAIDSSARAVALDPNGYENWLTRAAVYASVVPLNIQGAFENSLTALDEARKRSPLTPEIDLRIAEMRQVRGEREPARLAAEAALKIKPDYTPAILLLAQLSFEEGKLDEAIKSVAAAVYLEPQNPLLLYQLGLLELQSKNYKDAALAFEGALKLNADYANAQFFLGETYVFLGRTDDALRILKQLREKNSTSAVLNGVIDVIEKGNNPFAAKPSPTPEEKKPVQ